MKKINLLYLFVILLTVSCQNEGSSEFDDSESLLDNEKISLDDLMERNPTVAKLADQYNHLNSVDFTTSREDINDFQVLTNDIQHVYGGDYDSYTFPIFRNENHGFEGFENLLLSRQKDNSYKPFLVVYDITSEEKEQLTNGEDIDLGDKVSFIDIDFDVDTLLTGRFGGTLATCPSGACCRVKEETSRATGLKILVFEIIECEEEKPIIDQGDSGGNGPNQDDRPAPGPNSGPPTNGGNPGGPTTPDGSGFGGVGSGSEGSGNGSGSPTLGGGTIPIIPILDERTRVRFELDRLVEEGPILEWEFSSNETNTEYDSLEEFLEAIRTPYDQSQSYVETVTDQNQDGTVTKRIVFPNFFRTRTIILTMIQKPEVITGTVTENWELVDFESVMTGFTPLQEWIPNRVPLIEIFFEDGVALIEFYGIVKSGIKLIGVDFRKSTLVTLRVKVDMENGNVLHKNLSY